MKPCFGLFLLVMLACNNHRVPAPAQTTFPQTNDTNPVIPQSNTDEPGMPVSFIPGYYTGLLPCTDCDNINRKILFLKDHHFHMRDQFIGKVAAPIEYEGNWQATNDQVQLLVNDTVIKRFAVTSKGLIEVNTTGSRIIKSTEDYLTRKEIGYDNNAWMQKKAEGIDFLALGTEPFWMMEIDNDKQISFLRIDDNKPVIFPYAAAVPQNGQLIYNVKSDTSKMQITITPQFCTDGMSDNWYEYKVESNFNGTVYTGCGVSFLRQ